MEASIHILTTKNSWSPKPADMPSAIPSHLQKVADQEDQNPKINAVIDYYLSPYHRDKTEMGCIIPALSTELAHSSEDVRQVFTQELERMIDFISTLAGIDTSKGSALFSTMVGSLILARTVNNPELSDNLLSAGKQSAKKLVMN